MSGRTDIRGRPIIRVNPLSFMSKTPLEPVRTHPPPSRCAAPLDYPMSKPENSGRDCDLSRLMIFASGTISEPDVARPLSTAAICFYNKAYSTVTLNACCCASRVTQANADAFLGRLVQPRWPSRSRSITVSATSARPSARAARPSARAARSSASWTRASASWVFTSPFLAARI